MPVMHQERYRAQDPVPVSVRRPGASTSATAGAAAGAAPQSTRTEVTIHHSPGMTAQDYKESVEQEEEA